MAFSVPKIKQIWWCEGGDREEGGTTKGLDFFF